MPQTSEIFKLNEFAQVRVESISDDCPVLVIDGFYAFPDSVRELALNGNYDSSMAYYPGVHSRIDRTSLNPMLNQITRLLALISKHECDSNAFTSDFSLVTTPAKDMLAGQKHPHVDGVALAGVIYLSPYLTIGTSFFRHVPSGFSLLRTEEESKTYNSWLKSEGDSTQPATYAVGDGITWQKLHTIEGLYNRLVMYPGNAFHSIAMDDVSDKITLDSARLTQRFFLPSFKDSGTKDQH
jgi:hypothetical protein